MERFGIVEMEAVADVHRFEQRTGFKSNTFHTVLDNNFNKVPRGWTVVFLQNTPVQVVPDQILEAVKMESIGGFEHDPEHQRLVCFHDALTEEGTAVFRSVMGLVINWLNVNI